MKSNAPKLLGWISGLIGALGVFLLLRPLDGCGRVLSPDLSAAQIVDVAQGANSGERHCFELLERATVPAWMVFGVSVLLAITAIIVSQMNKRPAPARPSGIGRRGVTSVSDLEVLVALREQNKISEEDFQSFKASIVAKDAEPSS